MSKYSFEFKLNVVLDYLSGETGGYKTLAKKYNTNRNLGK
ncbi:MAG: transposase [Firmicutes bacterium]|nr:transposase [Bacillota bacterium]